MIVFDFIRDNYQIGVWFLLIFSILELTFLYRKVVRLFTTGHEFNLRKQMDISKKTDIIISELRALIQADRISIIKFHNGSEFLPNNPIWKITSDNQVKADGISYEDIEGVLVSRIQSIIEPIITGEVDGNGASFPSPCLDCENSTLCRECNMRIIRFDCEGMNGYSKMFIQKRGTKTAFISTINNGDKKVFGLLLAEYTNILLPDDERHIVHTVCGYTEKLRFLFA